MKEYLARRWRRLSPALRSSLLLAAAVNVIVFICFYPSFRDAFAEAHARREHWTMSAEARANVHTLAVQAVAAYERDGRLCASSSASVPPDVARVRGTTYASVESEWRVDPADTGFTCLDFRISTPQRYTYAYEQMGPSGNGGSFRVVARGDLDGDGVLSTIAAQGEVRGGGAYIAPNLEENDPLE